MSFSRGQKIFLDEVSRVLVHLESQASVFEVITEKIYESLKSGNVLHVFGSGHSHSFAEEMFHRAGGLVPVNAWLEEALMPHAGPKQAGPLERLSGFAQIIFSKYDARPGEVLVIASNSGINASSVELAQIAKAKGLVTVAVTSLTHTKNVPTRSAKKLFEVVDFTIDTGTPLGDACVPLNNQDLKVSPLSGVASSIVAELLCARIAERFTEQSLVAPIYQSVNTPGGEEHNRVLEAKYAHRIRFLK